MMTVPKPTSNHTHLSTALSNTVKKTLLASLIASISLPPAIAAPESTSRTLPVRTVEQLPDINRLSKLQIQEHQSTQVLTTTSNPDVQSQHLDQPDAQSQMDEMASLIHNKSITVYQIPSEADQISADELTQNDVQSDNIDDISGGQAVAQPSSEDPLSYELPEHEQHQDFSNDPTIKSIENKNGKLYTTLNLSNYARQVNESIWSPDMKVNSAMTVKMQALLDWNHASPGPIDGGWGMNSKKALTNFQTMHNLPATGRMNQKTWNALIKNIPANQPVLVEYTITQEDVNTNFAITPATSEAKSKMRGLYYQTIQEMLAERFHMDIRYLEKLNKGKQFRAGDTITVINPGEQLKQRITHVVANKADMTLYAYNGNQLVATYPTTVGSSTTPSPHGTFKIVNKVKMPWYRATVGEGDSKQVFMLPPGPNNPVGVVWMGLSKPSYGIHGSPKPEGISRQASHGCIRLTNWDVLEVYANIVNGATVELK